MKILKKKKMNKILDDQREVKNTTTILLYGLIETF